MHYSFLEWITFCLFRRQSRRRWWQRRRWQGCWCWWWWWRSKAEDCYIEKPWDRFEARRGWKDGQRPDGEGCEIVQDAAVRQLLHPGTGQSLSLVLSRYYTLRMDQSVTFVHVNLFLQIYIWIFVCVKFLIQIYSDIHSCKNIHECHTLEWIETEWMERKDKGR